MKNKIIAILVGAIIVFMYQFLSWMVLPIHANSFKYSENEDAILTTLSGSIKEDGIYMVPNRKPGQSMEDHMEEMKAKMGKPWATVNYHSEMKDDMAKAMSLGFLTVLLSVAIVVWFLARHTESGTFGGRFMVSLMMGVFIVIYDHASEAIFMSVPGHYIIPEVIDAILAWSLCGLWLAWWFGRKPAVPATA